MDKKAKPERHYDLDWLRVLATFAVVLFHVMRFFDVDPWEVKNNATSELFTIFIALFAQWMMPLFFVISGAAIHFALRFRNPWQFATARVTRILIPFLTVGVFILVPPQVYILVVHGERAPELAGMSLLEFYPVFLANISVFSSQFPYVTIPAMHLWYLEYLFIFSVLLLPLFIYLKTPSGQSLIGKIAAVAGRGWTVYLLAIPIGLLMVFLDPETPLGNFNSFGGWPLLAYPLFMVSGFLLFSDNRYDAAIEQQARPALILAFVSFAVSGYFIIQFLEGRMAFGSPSYTGFMMLRSLSSWLFIVGFLDLSRRYLNFTSPKLRYLSEASLPIYMLHQTVIVVIGFFIVDWQLAILPKFGFLLVTAVITIMAIYEILIRRLNPVRFLFGLKPVR